MGHQKAKCIRSRIYSSETLEPVVDSEIATSSWVHWYSTSWLDSSLGVEAEEGNTIRGTTREEQDQVAALSYQRAEAAMADGVFADEIAPVEVKTGKGTVIVDTDEGVRPGTAEEALAGLRPAFAKDGTITPASPSQVSDGAAAGVLTTRGYAEANGLEVVAGLGAYGETTGPDTYL